MKYDAILSALEKNLKYIENNALSNTNYDEKLMRCINYELIAREALSSAFYMEIESDTDVNLRLSEIVDRFSYIRKYLCHICASRGTKIEFKQC